LEPQEENKAGILEEHYWHVPGAHWNILVATPWNMNTGLGISHSVYLRLHGEHYVENFRRTALE
jgi:hypothetical protein